MKIIHHVCAQRSLHRQNAENAKKAKNAKNAQPARIYPLSKYIAILYWCFCNFGNLFSFWRLWSGKAHQSVRDHFFLARQVLQSHFPSSSLCFSNTASAERGCWWPHDLHFGNSHSRHRSWRRCPLMENPSPGLICWHVFSAHLRGFTPWHLLLLQYPLFLIKLFHLSIHLLIESSNPSMYLSIYLFVYPRSKSKFWFFKMDRIARSAKTAKNAKNAQSFP